MKYSEKVNKLICPDVEPDEVLHKVSEKLAPNVHDNLDSFIKSLSKDETFRPAGELVYSFSVGGKISNKSNFNYSTRIIKISKKYSVFLDNEEKRDFEVYKADMSYTKFKEYHLRLQTFLLWYVDAANFIDIDDDQWHYFNM